MHVSCWFIFLKSLIKINPVLCVFLFLLVMDVIYLIYLNQFLIFFFDFFLFSVIVYILLIINLLIFYIFFVVIFTGLLFVIISLILHMELTYLKNLVFSSVGNFQLYNMLLIAHGLLILLFIIIRILVGNLVIFFLPLFITILEYGVFSSE